MTPRWLVTLQRYESESCWKESLESNGDWFHRFFKSHIKKNIGRQIDKFVSYEFFEDNKVEIFLIFPPEEGV